MRSSGKQALYTVWLALVSYLLLAATAVHAAKPAPDAEFWLWLEAFGDDEAEVMDPIDFIQSAAAVLADESGQAEQQDRPDQEVKQ